MMTVQDLVDAIELCQPVLNKSDINLTKSVSRVADLSVAQADDVAFLSNPKYKQALSHSQAGVVLISQKFADELPKTPTVFVVVKDAYLAHASISTLFAYQSNNTGIHPTAIIADSAKIGDNVSIGAYSIIGERTIIGSNSIIKNHVVIEDDVEIGEGCYIDSHVFIAHHSQLGFDVRLHSHASIGAEGFGFAPKAGKPTIAWQRIAQLGRVIVGQRVRIGANTCIDRGAVGDTVIGDDVIIDNLVQIAHNVCIGAGTAIAAKVGIAGSTIIGKNCVVGGAVGIAGHLSIADGVTLTGMTMVINDIKQAGVYSSGTVAMPSMQWRRAAVKFRQFGTK